MIETIRYIISRLADIYPPDEAKAIAWWILEESTGMSRTQLLTACKDTKIIPNLEIIIERIHKKEPIQYIFGHVQWKNLELEVNKSTLIPRPETAELVDWVSNILAQETNKCIRVADIGTGSGCIAIAIAKEHPLWKVSAFDKSHEALEVAKRNAENNHVDIAFDEVDILSDEIGTIDVIISNPPYIRESEKISMDSGVLDYEPHSALFVPDNNPLLFYKRIAQIKKASHLFFEINEALGPETCKILEDLGYTDITLKEDSYGKPRMLYGRIAPTC